MENSKINLANELKPLLADLFMVYTKLRNYHWNVEGVYFYQLHQLFEKLFNEFADDIDEVAERIRILGVKAPGTLHEYINLAKVKELPGEYPDANEMIRNIINDFEYLKLELNKLAKRSQNLFEDEVSAGLLYELVGKYEKHLWMIKMLDK